MKILIITILFSFSTHSFALLECKKKETETLLTGVDSNKCKITYKQRSISGAQTAGEPLPSNTCCVSCKDGKWVSMSGIINAQKNCEAARGIFMQIDKSNSKCCVNSDTLERTCTSSYDLIEVSEQDCSTIKGTAYTPVQLNSPTGKINCCYNCKQTTSKTRAQLSPSQCARKVNGFSYQIDGIYYCCY